MGWVVCWSPPVSLALLGGVVDARHKARAGNPLHPEGSFRVSAASEPEGPKSCRRARSGGLPALAGRAQWSGQKGKRRSRWGQQPRPMLFGSGFPLVVMRWIGCGDGPLLRLTSGCHGAREATTRLRRERQVCTRNPTLSGVEPLSAVGRSVELMTRQHWEHRLPDGVQMQGRDSDGFRLVVSIPVGDDGLWPMRCPQRPRDHVFKIQVGQEQEPTSVVHCPYCGYRADLWAFAPQQLAVAEAAATAVAE